MTDWKLYEVMLNNGAKPQSKRDMIVEQAVSTFESGISDDPAYQKDATVNGVPCPIVASPTSKIECDIKASTDSGLKIGDMVFCCDDNWIVVDCYSDKVGLINGKMWRCNHLMRFQTQSTKIHERYCVIDDGSYSKRTTDSDAYVMTNSYVVYISLDDDTKKLHIDKRLSVGVIFSADGNEVLEVYKIIGADIKSHNFGEGSHILVLTLQRDVYHSECDSIEYGICDVVEAEEAHDESNRYIKVSGKDTIRVGTKRKYSIALYEDEKVLTDDILVTWNVSVPSSVKYEIRENICEIEVPLKEALIGETLEINVSAESYGACKKKVQVVSVG